MVWVKSTMRYADLVLLIAALHFARADEIIQNVFQLEKLYLELHPDTDDVTWEETANLTAESLKNVCDQVLSVLSTLSNSTDSYTYEPVKTSDLRAERMVKSALLPLENHKNDQIAHVPVIKCFYKEKKFYLTHADDGMVFELHCENADQNIYTLKSGVYRVEYSE